MAETETGSRRAARAAVWNKLCFFRVRSVDLAANGRVVEADVRYRGKKSLRDGAAGAVRELRAAVRSAGEADQRPGQLVLQIRGVRFFAAHARVSFAACAAGRLFALKTKHFVVHFYDPFCFSVPVLPAFWAKV